MNLNKYSVGDTLNIKLKEKDKDGFLEIKGCEYEEIYEGIDKKYWIDLFSGEYYHALISIRLEDILTIEKIYKKKLENDLENN